ncbi:hypothetical protein TcasGA2_TC010499 [Tribolium castaneum]|uniref:Uncharacterized protein n=1 Tax=Tribolium castaneum TaxID=7070 RepID=D6WE26_TRICA|nr:hypothetical protein TcasGA2_TC010499 [Tribolium castaneum]
MNELCKVLCCGKKRRSMCMKPAPVHFSTIGDLDPSGRRAATCILVGLVSWNFGATLIHGSRTRPHRFDQRLI